MPLAYKIVALALLVVFIVLSALFWKAWSAAGDKSVLAPALLGLFGVLLTGLIAVSQRVEKHFESAALSKARNERKQRLLIALRAELALNAKAQFAFFEPVAAAKLATKLKAVIEEAETGGMPMAVVSQTNDVYDSVKGEIADLPEEVISPVINYYQQDEYVAQLLTQFARGDFDKLSEERRKGSIDALFRSGEGALKAAIEAFSAVDAALTAEDVIDGQAARKTREEILQMKEIVFGA